ncbi:hypothetical protein ABBQ38_012630 [Trebouxia sp. C0009 RCD-2024]
MVIRCLQFMIMSKEVTPCTRAVLLPETIVNHRGICSEQARRDTLPAAGQLMKWMHQASEQLAEQHRARDCAGDCLPCCCTARSRLHT